MELKFGVEFGSSGIAASSLETLPQFRVVLCKCKHGYLHPSYLHTTIYRAKMCEPDFFTGIKNYMTTVIK